MVKSADFSSNLTRNFALILKMEREKRLKNFSNLKIFQWNHSENHQEKNFFFQKVSLWMEAGNNNISNSSTSYSSSEIFNLLVQSFFFVYFDVFFEKKKKSSENFLHIMRLANWSSRACSEINSSELHPNFPFAFLINSLKI